MLETSQQPITRPIGLPIHRVFRAILLAPLPTVGVPDHFATIAAVIDEGLKFPVGDGRLGNLEGLDGHWMGPFLVVEQKRRVRGRAHLKHTARNLGPSGMGPRCRLGRDIGGNGQGGRRIGQGLTGPKEGFRVHVFMEDAKLIDEAVLLRCHTTFEAPRQSVEDRLHIGKGLGPG